MVTGNAAMGLVGKALHRQRHAGEEERLRLLLAAMAVGSSDQLLSLGYCQCGEEIGKHRSQRSAQPDIKEVRQGRRSQCCRSKGGSVETTLLVLTLWLVALA